MKTIHTFDEIRAGEKFITYIDSAFNVCSYDPTRPRPVYQKVGLSSRLQAGYFYGGLNLQDNFVEQFHSYNKVLLVETE